MMLAKAMGAFARRRDKNSLKRSISFDELPSFPAVLADALQRLRDPSGVLVEIGERIATDPAMSARLLRTANSTAFALKNPVRSVAHAVSLLGRGQVESLLLGAVVAGVSTKLQSPLFDARAFWLEAARRALVARAIAKDVRPGRENEAFTEALLQEMGVPLLVRAKGEQYAELLRAWQAGEGELYALERDRFGFDHAEVAGWMAEKWEFPPVLVSALSEHHESEDTPSSFVALYPSLASEELDATGFDARARERFSVSEEQAAMWRSEIENADELARALVS